MNYRGTLGAMGSHFPILAAAVAATKGPVLELGCGDWSTPMLHYMCKAMERDLATFETNKPWLARFAEYDADPGHTVQLCADWETCHLLWPRRWGVAFVDCAPGEIRPFLIEKLRACTDLIVVHDTERDHDVGSVVRYDLISASFKYKSEFRRFRPYTMVLSDSMPVATTLIDDVDKEWIPPPDWDQIKHQP